LPRPRPRAARGGRVHPARARRRAARSSRAPVRALPAVGGAVIVRESLADVPPGERAVALGSFDGVHRGHQAVIGNAVSEAEARGLKSAVITFHPPPIAVLRPDIQLIQLSTLSRRAALVAELGVDELVILRLHRAFSRVDADAFARQVLAETLGARHVSIGENFHYGQGARGPPRKRAAGGAPRSC